MSMGHDAAAVKARCTHLRADDAAKPISQLLEATR